MIATIASRPITPLQQPIDRLIGCQLNDLLRHVIAPCHLLLLPGYIFPIARCVCEHRHDASIVHSALEQFFREWIILRRGQRLPPAFAKYESHGAPQPELLRHLSYRGHSRALAPTGHPPRQTCRKEMKRCASSSFYDECTPWACGLPRMIGPRPSRQSYRRRGGKCSRRARTVPGGIPTPDPRDPPCPPIPPRISRVVHRGEQ
jgi:hypothetical protein